MPKIPMKMAGIRIVVILNALPRTCSRYSRFAISQILCIGLASHGLNEYLFQRRLDQLELIDARLADGLAQQRLRIRAVFQLQLGMAGVILELRNRFMFQE